MCPLFACVYRIIVVSIVPDIHLSGLDSSKESQAALLSALGLSSSRPTPPTYKHVEDDTSSNELQLEENILKPNTGSNGSETCEVVVVEVVKLKSNRECVIASNRVLGAMECLIARKILFTLIASFNFVSKDSQRSKLMTFMEMMQLNDIKKLINLLRLVQAGRIDRVPGKRLFVTVPRYSTPVCIADCLGNAVSLMASSEEQGGAQLLQVLYLCIFHVHVHLVQCQIRVTCTCNM